MSDTNPNGAPTGAPFFISSEVFAQIGDPIDAAAVRAVQHDLRNREIGSDIRFLPAIDSTNRVARDLAAGEWRDGTVIWADYQTAGRGRQGRSWIAPPGSSLLLSIMRSARRSLPLQTAVMPAALAVQAAIRRVTGAETALKWPNDIMLQARKVCGILAEVSGPTSDRRVIVGIGLNVNRVEQSEGFPDTAATLQDVVGHAISRRYLAVALFEHLNLWYGILTEDHDRVFKVWSSSLHITGKTVAVHDYSGVWIGTVVDVKRDGALRIRDPEGVMRSVYAADVSIREPEDFTGP